MGVRVCCDFCDRPLSLEAGEGGCLAGTIRHWLFQHLCRDCVEKIDQVLVFAKDEWLKQIDISVKNGRINTARKELLGTKG